MRKFAALTILLFFVLSMSGWTGLTKPTSLERVCAAIHASEDVQAPNEDDAAYEELREENETRGRSDSAAVVFQSFTPDNLLQKKLNSLPTLNFFPESLAPKSHLLRAPPKNSV